MHAFDGLPVRVAGTIDEKIYQRQLNKGEMAEGMQQEGGNKGATKRKASRFTRDELRALFSLNSPTACDTADLLRSTLSGPDWQVKDTATLCIGSEM